MEKTIFALILAGMISVPSLTFAQGSDVDVEERTALLEQQIHALEQQLNELRSAVAAQAKKQKNQHEQLADDVEDLNDDLEDMDERSEAWDLASRFTFYGDFRARMDYYSAESIFGRSIDNDTILTNRLRLNLRVKASDNVEFKGRLAMFKTWGNQSAFTNEGNPTMPIFDGNVTRSPGENSALYVDRAYVNWTNIADLPMWFSIGRRPTTDGPPAQLRLGLDSRMATPMAFMDWPFDGLALGYAWNWGDEDSGNSRIRFCYGRGFEAGLEDDVTSSVDDMDFAGISWDILNRDQQFLYIQSFMAFDLINYPSFQDSTVAPMFGDRKNLGNVWHTAAVYQDKIANLNYFLSTGWSQTHPNAEGMFNDPLAATGANTNQENGYAVYLGLRYDLNESGLQFGAEWNYGSQYWLAMSPGHDEIYQSKLATRGNVFELYTIWNIPAGELLSDYAKNFIRLGYQHYEYDYFGSGDWNMYPYDLDDSGDRAKLQMMGLDPVESADQIYVSFESYF